LPHGGKYQTLKYKYKYSGHKYEYEYKYFETVLEYYSSTSTRTKYYISATYRTCNVASHYKGAYNVRCATATIAQLVFTYNRQVSLATALVH